MSALETYINEAILTKGIAHSNAIRSLRTYLNEITDEEFKNAVWRITNPEHLRILWEAGLKRHRQDIVLNQYNMLTRPE